MNSIWFFSLPYMCIAIKSIRPFRSLLFSKKAKQRNWILDDLAEHTETEDDETECR